MIGYGWEYKGKWRYKTLIVNRLTRKKRIVKNLLELYLSLKIHY